MSARENTRRWPRLWIRGGHPMRRALVRRPARGNRAVDAIHQDGFLSPVSNFSLPSAAL
jgi:hypothetical protein